MMYSLALASAGAAAQDTVFSATVVEPYLDMRTQRARLPVFYVAEQGEHLELLRQRTDWIKVRNARGIEGWVHVDDIGKTVDGSGGHWR